MTTTSAKPKITLSVDDGCNSDIRIYKLAKKYKIPTTFYWPLNWYALALEKGYQPLSFVDARIIASEFEVGAHGLSHAHLTKLPPMIAHEEIFYSGIMLGKLFDQKITKFCPSRGYLNKELTEYTLRFYKSIRLTKGPNLIHIHPDSGANENRPWREVMDEKLKNGINVEGWLHSWEIDKFNMWEELEEWLNQL